MVSVLLSRYERFFDVFESFFLFSLSKNVRSFAPFPDFYFICQGILIHVKTFCKDFYFQICTSGYTNLWFKMAIVLNMQLNRYSYSVDIGGFHLTSSPPCWCTEQSRKNSFGNLTYYYAKHEPSFAIVLCTKMAVLSRD